MTINEPDSRSYESLSTNQSPHFSPTILPDALLSRRLLAEIDFVIRQIKQNWPHFKADPFGSIALASSQMMGRAKRTIARPQTALAVVTSFAILTSVVIVVLMIERRGATRVADDYSALELTTTLNLASSSETEEGKGIGAGEKGRVGFARGAGEGSRPTPARSHGGGGGGSHSQLAASQGRVPVSSIIPAPIPTAAVHLPQALPVAGIDLDPALYRRLDYSTYGDPRSKSPAPSNGSGDGVGIGNGNGTGIGEGDGPGFGPGHDGNIGGDGKRPGGGGVGGAPGNNPNDNDDARRVYKSPEVSTRPRVISKPEPQYTEQARRDQITGTVVLRAVFSSSGEVTNINAVQKLGGGLTEKAIAAARQIRFVPATRNGHAVSMFMQLEYNFNLY
jgi:TonB family protein